MGDTPSTESEEEMTDTSTESDDEIFRERGIRKFLLRYTNCKIGD